NANSMWAMLGDYSFPAMSYFWKKVENDLDHPHTITLLEGMKASKPEGVNLMYSRGCDWTEEIETKFSELGDERAWEYDILHRKVDSGEKADKAEALAMAKDADVIIAAMGENVMLCGENRDRQGLRLPGKQEQYVEELIKTGKPVVLVVFGGRAQVISGIAEKCAAVIQAWYPGEEGGNAVADILYGKVSPSAKLSVSYPNTELYGPICYNSLETSTSDTSHSSLLLPPSSKIQWPFGYGLTYTTFEYANLQVNSEAQTSDDFVELTFQVKNTGKVAATEIAQIYLSPTDSTHSSFLIPHSSNIRPIQLQGFVRVALEPGQTKTVTTRVYVEQLGFYSHNGSVRQWNIEPGTYTFKVGASSADIRLQQQLILRGSSVTKPLRDHYFSESLVSL
ncbi:MAG: glycoside hydrolase family 3 C-terminal domain-containing protein, partial [Prevotella sp.]|nr:glycoside hydrolase family 3 C-terminal domain-containing protein [Prevotella sp.]